MRNKIDLTLSPDALFLNPWQDEGLTLLAPPDWIWRMVPAGRIHGFAVSAHAPIQQKINSFLKVTARQKRFAQAVAFNALPAVIERASFRKSSVLVGEKLLLTGASGVRALNSFRWENEGADPDPAQQIEDYFSACRKANEGRSISALNRSLEPDIDFAISCRNTFNYYHFMTESLSQLTILDGLEFTGNIYFHFPNQEEKQRPFSTAFVEALFPEFAGRVFFERTPKDYDRVLTAYEMLGGHHQAPQADFAGMADHAPAPLREEAALASHGAQAVLAMNALRQPLLALRERALRAIEGRDFSHLPRRFFVGRDDRQSRTRQMAGEDRLFEHLALFGFDYVVFENLDPLEQIALMANAEMMISYHGAGFTNMLFAAPDAWVIELGTLQTAQFRWGDFWPLAHASGCRYVSFFADFNAVNPLSEPDFKEDGILPVHLSDGAIAQVMAFVVTVLGQYPELSSLAILSQTARQVFEAGSPEHAVGLIERHPKMLERSAELCLLKADCHKELDEPKSELVALDLAYKADRSRWQTLVRIIWCANRCERPQVIRWALSRLAQDFPQRHENFVSNHDWVRYVA